LDNLSSIIQLNKASATPRYKQIVSSIELALLEERLSVGDKIPSLNELVKAFDLSQDTILMAYNELKTRGIVASAVGKGYFIAANNVALQHKVFVLFDKLTAYKEVLYESMKKHFGKNTTLDIYFHHANEKVFKNLLEDAAGRYTSYVIMPLEEEKCLEWIKELPGKQVFLLDRGKRFGKLGFKGVFQNFEIDTYLALKQGIDHLKKYKRINVVTPDNRSHLLEIIRGCRQFCKDHEFTFRHLKRCPAINGIQTGDVYLIIHDNDLVLLTQHIQKADLSIGRDIGLISYNDSPLKQIAVGGVTTISTDFENMGKEVVNMVLNRHKKSIDNKSGLIIRNSL